MEKEKTVFLIGISLAFLIYLIPGILIMYHVHKEQKEQGLPSSQKALFDERQKLLRSQASFHALLFLCGFLSVWALVHHFSNFSWTTKVTEIVFCGLMLTFTIRQIEFILRDVVIGWNQKPEAINAQLICSFCYGFVFIILGAEKETSVMITCMIAALSCWVLFGVMCYAKHRRNKAETLPQPDSSDEEVDAP